MRIKPSTDTPSTQPHSPQSPMPIDDHAMLQSRFERALKENPDQTKPQPNDANNQAALEAKKPFTENYSERSLASLHSTSSNQRKTAEKSAFAQSGDAVTENKNNESDTSSLIAMNTQDKMPSDMDAHMKSDIRIPTTGDKKLPMEPSNKREKNADEQDAFERLVEDHDDSKTELATAKTAELHESTQSPKDTKQIPTVGTKPNTMETVSDALASTLASTTVASATSASTLASTTVASATSASLASHPVTSTVHKTATKTEVNKHEGDSSLGFNSRNLKTLLPNDEHPKASQAARTLLDKAMLDSEKSSDKPMHQPVTTPITQGDVILKGISTPQPTQPTREVSQLIQQLVGKVYVALPTASNEKEVRLFLSEGQLKGGEIHIKLDSQGYSVTIRQEHALSIINQQARQDLAERLNRMGFEQPLRVSISEQTSQHGHTQQDQQQSRQQRSVYEEWQPEADQ
ncbi:TPA: type III secretion system needle length determinant [Vibrio parahaemolyticus]|uniref:type III secretion system needle length determinant n=1 Tax=Vibrio parahaemolyticus TaxID=670 RepID=UPI000812D655|nr:type III secretion system needle length determinant [Vibrio parahaemolyticus]EGQ8245480.1 type III secretion system needle length determinant [Vibrio parahaemolyticus]EGQ8931503.1 type III secretion system needle length determinant [Vibrio parahaemolyticus]EGQ8976139.1 type III secretion system needle length determinant [Vibrio parahaemolyticus]EGQ8981111.1 type III secretion system needle length determinant [Vibrio parahaemolyticus]EGQ8999895.1 type III secretion system needle length deter